MPYLSSLTISDTSALDFLSDGGGMLISHKSNNENAR